MDRPLDPETWKRVREVLHAAATRGLDPIEELHRARLLLTKAEDKLIRLQAMNYLLKQLESWSPHEFLRRRFSAEHSATPADMYMVLLEFVQDHIEWWEKEQ